MGVCQSQGNADEEQGEHGAEEWEDPGPESEPNDLPTDPNNMTKKELIQLVRCRSIQGVSDAKWVLVRPGESELHEIPGAMIVGKFHDKENGFVAPPDKNIYLGRIHEYRAGIHNGQVASCIGGLQLCADGNEVILPRAGHVFEVLTGNGVTLQWLRAPKTAAGRERLAKCAIPVGVEAVGWTSRPACGEAKLFNATKIAHPLWAARVFYKGDIIIGRAGPGIAGGRVALVPIRKSNATFSGTEKKFTEFQVLVDGPKFRQMLNNETTEEAKHSGDDSEDDEKEVTTFGVNLGCNSPL